MSEDIHLLAGAYALDALDADERREFERHYPDCESCRTEVADFRATAAVLAEAAAEEPPASVRDAVLAGITETRQLSPLEPARTTRRFDLRRAAAPLALAAAVVIAVFGLVALLASDDAPTSEVETLLAAPDAEVAELDGEQGSGRVVWSAEREEIAVVGTGWTEAGDGEAYALWLVDGDDVTAAGLFTPDDGGIRQVVDAGELETVPDLDTADEWAVTVEPEGGSDQPTGEIIYETV